MKKYYKYFFEYVFPHIGYVRKACWKMSKELKNRALFTRDGVTRKVILIDPFGTTKWFIEELDISPFQMFWQGLTHDLSRFRPSEFIAYANSHGAGKVKRDKNGQYSGTAISNDPVEVARERAMMWHWNRNRHHWEHWAIVLHTTHHRFPEDEHGTMIDETPSDVPDVKFVNIPDRYLLEMACDWWGASMTQGMGGKIYSRYLKVKDTLHMSKENREKFEFCLMWVEQTMNGSVYVEKE